LPQYANIGLPDVRFRIVLQIDDPNSGEISALII